MSELTKHDQEAAAYFATLTKAPRVESLIERYKRRFPGIGKASLARYFEEVHQALAPLARELERENGELRAEIDRLNETIRGSMLFPSLLKG
ncbi:hypothetical protein DIE14_01270 [Burkholderia sp. Bp9017]|uniref:hypothetical protein n=1 Tax=unclassified Burkholderia TaxID=2613784 RepID=UPI000F5DF101|nr:MULTISPECIES: hypothetical protein [unclassified Burkholderia]RQZ31574.1 hypothetical protein DIE14_01270 [Burkholderia sp. Bp9017]RQZ37706.1 hypothetical protein DIE13_01260 [Burkholderia sp. Bp9016]